MGKHFVPPLPTPPRSLACHRMGFTEIKRQTHCRGLHSCILALRSVFQLPPLLYALPAASYIFIVVTATDLISLAMCSSAHANNSYRSLLFNPTNFTALWQISQEGQLQRSIKKKHENLYYNVKFASQN